MTMEQAAQTNVPKTKRRYAHAGTANDVPTPAQKAPARPKAASKQTGAKPQASRPRVTKADIVIGLLDRKSVV